MFLYMEPSLGSSPALAEKSIVQNRAGAPLPERDRGVTA